MFERLLIGRRHRSIAFHRAEQVHPNRTEKIVTREEWVNRLNKERNHKEEIDNLIYDFLSVEGQKEAAEAFKREAHVQCKSGVIRRQQLSLGS